MGSSTKVLWDKENNTTLVTGGEKGPDTEIDVQRKEVYKN